MQGKQSQSPDLFIYCPSLENFVPDNHFLRKIETLIDLTFVRELTKHYYCKNNGRPSIDPELFFRMLLIQYLYGISSERRLCEDIQCNLAYRWFCRLALTDKVPNHSSISKIRDRLGEHVFESFFNYVLEVCRKYGLVRGNRIMTDSTLIEANASLAFRWIDIDRNVTREVFSVLKCTEKKFIEIVEKISADKETIGSERGTLLLLLLKNECLDEIRPWGFGFTLLENETNPYLQRDISQRTYFGYEQVETLLKKANKHIVEGLCLNTLLDISSYQLISKYKKKTKLYFEYYIEHALSEKLLAEHTFDDIAKNFLSTPFPEFYDRYPGDTKEKQVLMSDIWNIERILGRSYTYLKTIKFWMVIIAVGIILIVLKL